MMSKSDSLFDFMENKALTTLEVFYNQKQDKFFAPGYE